MYLKIINIHQQDFMKQELIILNFLHILMIFKIEINKNCWRGRQQQQGKNPNK